MNSILCTKHEERHPSSFRGVGGFENWARPGDLPKGRPRSGQQDVTIPTSRNDSSYERCDIECFKVCTFSQFGLSLPCLTRSHLAPKPRHQRQCTPIHYRRVSRPNYLFQLSLKSSFEHLVKSHLSMLPGKASVFPLHLLVGG